MRARLRPGVPRPARAGGDAHAGLLDADVDGRRHRAHHRVAARRNAADAVGRRHLLRRVLPARPTWRSRSCCGASRAGSCRPPGSTAPSPASARPRSARRSRSRASCTPPAAAPRRSRPSSPTRSATPSCWRWPSAAACSSQARAGAPGGWSPSAVRSTRSATRWIVFQPSSHFGGIVDGDRVADRAAAHVGGGVAAAGESRRARPPVSAGLPASGLRGGVGARDPRVRQHAPASTRSRSGWRRPPCSSSASGSDSRSTSLRRLTEERHQQAVTDQLTGLAQPPPPGRGARCVLRRPRRSGDGRAQPRVPLRRSRPLQGGQRLVRPPGRRSAAAPDRPALCGLPRPTTTCSCASAATSSPSSWSAPTASARRSSPSGSRPRWPSRSRSTWSACASAPASGSRIAPEHAATGDDLMRCADKAMYRCKQAGTAFAVYDLTVDAERDRLQLVDDLRGAIARNELELHYQPQIDLRNGAISAVEALLRWPHPRLGYIPPLEFLPLAEEGNLMRPLTTLVLDQALAPVRALARRGPRPVGVDQRLGDEHPGRRLHRPRPRAPGPPPAAGGGAGRRDHRDDASSPTSSAASASSPS